MFEVLDQPTADIDVYSPEGDALSRADFEEDIKLQDITFVYPARPTERVLEGVNLEIQAGKVTGLVGPSGSGKSTVASLLLRLYDPPTGKVKLGNRDLRSINIKSLRSHVALVTQSPVLFSGTILDNIKLGLPEDEQITEAEALKRCSAAAAEAYCDFIEHLPEGMHTMIGSGHHSQLSGGQKQRIALARALVGKPALLLLDEYTSAMDATSEAVVLENLKRGSASSGRTTIIIAHRLATVKDADRIIVMKDGAAVEQGSHDDLIRDNGLYSELIRAQQFDKTKSSSSLTLVSRSESLENDTPKKKKPHNTASNTDLDTETADEPEKMKSGTLISRAMSLSRSEAPAVGIGLFASIISGAVTIGEGM